MVNAYALNLNASIACITRQASLIPFLNISELFQKKTGKSKFNCVKNHPLTRFEPEHIPLLANKMNFIKKNICQRWDLNPRQYSLTRTHIQS